MRITPGIGIAIGLGALGAVGAGIAIAAAHGDDDGKATGTPMPTPSPQPGPSPTPPGGDVPTTDVPAPPGPQPWTVATRVDGLTDRYMELYDHSGDGEIDLGWGQQFGTDERVTGGVGDIHTMVEFFRAADKAGDGNNLLTRDELRGAIGVFDTHGTIGFNPAGGEFGDGILGRMELLKFQEDAIQAYSDPMDTIDEDGVPQLLLDDDGSTRNNEGFFKALPDYRAMTGGVAIEPGNGTMGSGPKPDPTVVGAVPIEHPE